MTRSAKYVRFRKISTNDRCYDDFGGFGPAKPTFFYTFFKKTFFIENSTVMAHFFFNFFVKNFTFLTSGTISCLLLNQIGPKKGSKIGFFPLFFSTFSKKMKKSQKSDKKKVRFCILFFKMLKKINFFQLFLFFSNLL